ncbi:MAG TPA: ELM1/GtrOC1 family putative glycosyltransferase [Malonomonas sp.]
MTTNNAQPLLILSDGKPGHVNQSIAFARHLGRDYIVQRVAFKTRAAKAFSYLADRCGLLREQLFQTDKITGEYSAIVSAGSETYYANRVLARKLGLKSVAIMLPQGYRLDFDLIVAQQHDDPPQLSNIVSLPINLSFVEPQGLVVAEPGCRYVSIIIGGNSKQGDLDPETIRQQLTEIFRLFPDHRFWLTTSRRTPEVIEAVLKSFNFERAVFYSEEQINPIPDFLQHSEYVFLTADSTSMLSEAVSFGSSCVEVLSLEHADRNSKFFRFIQGLVAQDSAHIFNGQVGSARVKIDLAAALHQAESLLLVGATSANQLNTGQVGS